jgi:hypothetical protein
MKCIANCAILGVLLTCGLGPGSSEAAAFEIPHMWEYNPPLIAPEARDSNPSRAQKDPSVVFYDGKWHVFMTVKLQGKSAIEYCSFEEWEEADRSKRTILEVSMSDYYCAPQVFYFRPHKKWYLIYQMGVPGADKMWVAYSTTDDIADPGSWTQAMPILDGGAEDPLHPIYFLCLVSSIKAAHLYSVMNILMDSPSLLKWVFSGFSSPGSIRNAS